MDQYGDSDKPVWWTEFGFPVKPGTPCPDGQRAGMDLTDTYELARQSFPQVALGIVYTAYRPPGLDFAYRLLEDDGTPHPQLDALAQYFKQNPHTRPLFGVG